MSNNLPVLVEMNNYAVISAENDELAEIISENLDGETINISDLPSIKIPPEGVPAFNIDGDMAKEFAGILVGFANRRGYWEEKYDGTNANPPICSSKDGKEGTVRETGETIKCATCPFAQFGADNEPPKCRQTAQAFVLMEESFMPTVVSVPPTSLKSFKSYRTKLASKGKVFYSVGTKFSLMPSVTKNGNKANVLNFTVDSTMDTEQKNKLKSYVQAWKQIIGAADVTQSDFE